MIAVAVTGLNGPMTTTNLLRSLLESAGPAVVQDRADTRYDIVELDSGGAGQIASLAAIPRPDVAVLNADDAGVAELAGLTPATVRWFGLSDSADVRAEDIDATANGTAFTLVAGGLRERVQLRILGEHHVMNALAALTVALELGIPLSRSIPAIARVARAGRWQMEVLDPGTGVTIINDAYDANPESMAAALKTLVQVTPHGKRSVAVLGELADVGEYADEEHDRIGRLVVRLNVKKLIVIGHAARHIHNAAGLEGSWDGESLLVAGVDEAYDLLRDELREGDVVLVKSSTAAGLRFLGDRLGVGLGVRPGGATA